MLTPSLATSWVPTMPVWKLMRLEHQPLATRPTTMVSAGGTRANLRSTRSDLLLPHLCYVLCQPILKLSCLARAARQTPRRHIRDRRAICLWVLSQSRKPTFSESQRNRSLILRMQISSQSQRNRSLTLQLWISSQSQQHRSHKHRYGQRRRAGPKPTSSARPAVRMDARARIVAAATTSARLLKGSGAATRRQPL